MTKNIIVLCNELQSIDKDITQLYLKLTEEIWNLEGRNINIPEVCESYEGKILKMYDMIGREIDDIHKSNLRLHLEVENILRRKKSAMEFDEWKRDIG